MMLDRIMMWFENRTKEYSFLTGCTISLEFDNNYRMVVVITAVHDEQIKEIEIGRFDNIRDMQNIVNGIMEQARAEYFVNNGDEQEEEHEDTDIEEWIKIGKALGYLH